MTTREKAQKLLDELSEDELEPIIEILASRGTSGADPETADDAVTQLDEPEVAPLPDGWGLLPSGAPAPNWVAGLDSARRARNFLISVADGTSGLDLDSLRTVRDRAWR
jgi:hypothetical protein